jgi:AcrR family transcriptional regulator
MKAAKTPAKKKPVDHRTRVAAQRRARMRASLCEACLREAAKTGAESVSIDAVIARAGVSRGTFYKYFTTPAELVSAVGAELAQEIIVTIAPTVEKQGDPPRRLSAGFRMILWLVQDNPLLGRFLCHAGWPMTDHVPAFSQRVGANLAAGLSQGRFCAPSLEVAQAIVGGISVGMFAAIGKMDLAEAAISEATTALLLALGVEAREARRIAELPLDRPKLPAGGLLAQTK